MRVHEIQALGATATPTVVTGNIVNRVQFVASYTTTLGTVYPNSAAGCAHFMSVQTSVSVSVHFSVLVLQASSTNAFHKIDSAVFVEVVVPRGGLHHVVGVLNGFLVVPSPRVRKNEYAVLTALVPSTLVEVDAEAVGASSAEPTTASSPVVAPASGVNILTGLVKLPGRAKTIVSADSVVPWIEVDSHC
jgi:hypothetical protein